MKKISWLTVSIGLTLSLAAAVAGGSAVKFATYRKSHAALIQSPCYSDTRECAAFQYDLFGDGTVVYQHVDAAAPAVTYRIDPLTATWALWRLDHPHSNWKADGGGGVMHSGICIVLLERFGETRENGCGDRDLKQAKPVPPALRPFIKAVGLDLNKPDYAPTLRSGVTAKPFVTSEKYKVDPPYWTPSPPPPAP
jgi:hypothetical protein